MPSIRLKHLKYDERVGRPLEWSLDDLTLGAVNLLVGKNATGKTRTLNVIANLAKTFLNDQLHVQESGYDVSFEFQDDADNTEIKYSLNVEGGRVTKEILVANGVLKLDRNSNRLKIYGNEFKGMITFKPSSTEVSAAARRAGWCGGT